MRITLKEVDGKTFAVVESNTIVMADEQDAVELIMNCRWQGSDNIIVNEADLPADFFDLKTKLAGNILQKFSTYDARLAIVGDFSKYESSSLKDFIYESNKGRRINFVSSADEAISVLS